MLAFSITSVMPLKEELSLCQRPAWLSRGFHLLPLPLGTSPSVRRAGALSLAAATTGLPAAAVRGPWAPAGVPLAGQGVPVGGFLNPLERLLRLQGWGCALQTTEQPLRGAQGRGAPTL